MKKNILILLLTICVPVFTQAQDLRDALRYSNIQVSGTARAGGMGNAFGALGGDFTSVSINPAGLGVFRSSELTVTPKFTYGKTEGNYMNTLMEDTKYNFSLNNLSYVTVIPTASRSDVGLISVNLGIGYNRLKDFNSNLLMGGSGVTSSILDSWIENTNGENPFVDPSTYEFYDDLAIAEYGGTDLIYKEENSDIWQSDIQRNPYDQYIENDPVAQRKSISRTGSIDEYNFAVGLNFNHKVYLGATLGVTDIYYRESSTYEEWDDQNIIPNFESLQFDEYLRTTGTGYNFKFGIIYKPINEIRLGASIHTPTFYDLHNFYHNEMYATINYTDGTQNQEALSRLANYDYRLNTPLRATFSGAFVIAKKGLISIDYEYVDYSTAKLRKGGDGYNFTDENQEIKDAYKSVGNIRIGGELRATNNLSLRAGYEYYPTAYNSTSLGNEQFKSNDKLSIYSTGLGYRFGSLTFDLAYRLTDMEEYELPYSAPVSGIYPVPQAAKFDGLTHDVMFTLGFKF
ncbi:outer membrane protein transport protein [uncultured Draconibacterium sp.]|uniref:OmpP1/FadL family transporter n=1 Tax=uncultured Draconibacterium sp. TaxID=1573823 RepID=UPI002AA8FF0A|nr:outer membrane protein transport protein [uncultured Draconibacterium sp.]